MGRMMYFMKAVLCIDNHGNIGINGGLIFNIREDRNRFKEYITNKIILVGRKTYESLPYNLTRKASNVIVLTRNKEYKPKNNSYIVHNIDEFDWLCKKMRFNDDDIVIIGGAEIYNDLIPRCDEVFMTQVDTIVSDADTKVNMDIFESFRSKVVSKPKIVIDRNASSQNRNEEVSITFQYLYRC